MKIKLLKKIRRNAYVEKRNKEYRAVLKPSFFDLGFTSEWTTKQKAISRLKIYILSRARINYKRGKIKVY